MNSKPSFVVSLSDQITVPFNIPKKIETYTDQEVSDWLEKDKLSPDEKEIMVKKLDRAK